MTSGGWSPAPTAMNARWSVGLAGECGLGRDWFCGRGGGGWSCCRRSSCGRLGHIEGDGLIVEDDYERVGGIEVDAAGGDGERVVGVDFLWDRQLYRPRTRRRLDERYYRLLGVLVDQVDEDRF
jgi:hypothetical protein